MTKIKKRPHFKKWTNQEMKETIKEKSKRNPLTKCWNWQKWLCDGYGKIYVRGNFIGAHIFSYEAFKGKVPCGLIIMHKCDNRRCVNPRHLLAGTRSQNTLDSWKRGIKLKNGKYKKRQGIKNNTFSAKLTIADAKYVKASSKNSRELSEELGVSSSTIRLIRQGVTWKNA